MENPRTSARYSASKTSLAFSGRTIPITSFMPRSVSSPVRSVFGRVEETPAHPLAAWLELPGVCDVAELAPDQREQDRRADEREPERRRDAPEARDHASDELAGEDASEHGDQVEAADPALKLHRHRAHAHRPRGGAPDEGVRAEDEHDRHGHPAGPGEREAEMRQRLDHQADAHDVRQAGVALEPVVARGAEDAAGGDERRQQAEADRAETEAVRRVEHEHRPGRAIG